jgi:hypothetical protein
MNAQLVRQHIHPIARDVFVLFTYVGLGAEGNVIHVGIIFGLEAHAWLVFFEPCKIENQSQSWA